MKRPSFQFYPADWLSDPNVIAMSPAQRGGYIHLLALMWSTEDCFLKDDDAYLCRLSGLEPEDLRVVKLCFRVGSTNGQPALTHKRLDEERGKQDEWREKSSIGGKKSAEKRWGDRVKNKGGYKMVEPNGNTSSSTPTSSSTSITKTPRSRSARVFDENSAEFRLSKLLMDQILAFNERFKKPDLQKWSAEIDKMIRIDGRSVEDVEVLILWVTQDNFWKTNILSTTKLREHFDRCWTKAQSMQQAKRPSYSVIS